MQNKKAGIEELVPLISEAVKNGTEIRLTPRGRSMLPFLCERDIVVLSKPPKRLNKYDIALYYRKNGDVYVMHRLINIKDGEYVFCGDNQCYPEQGVKDGDIIAVVSSAIRNEKETMRGMGYLLYCRTLFVRRFLKKVKLHLVRR